MRYRLRFRAQELALPLGVSTIGRSQDCTMTLQDPLVSREHLRITVTEDGVVCENLHSRNGTRINGTKILGPTTLKRGDVLMLGTQELTFTEVDESRDSAKMRKTGAFEQCRACGVPYEKGTGCPNCGTAPMVLNEDEPITQTSQVGIDWGLALIIDAGQTAVRNGKAAGAEQLLTRAQGILKSHTNAAPAQVLAIAEIAAHVGLASDQASWAHWADELRRSINAPRTGANEELWENCRARFGISSVAPPP